MTTNFDPLEDVYASHAYDVITETNRHVLVTGKAGTGKSTFLKYLTNTIKKKTILLAPTGAAAVNINGSTIHSFLGFPNSILIAGEDNRIGKKLSRKSKQVIENLETLIIDETSMLRVDLIDAIDYLFKIVRNSNEPFGGVQLVLVGDLFQLPPVVLKEDRYKLSRHYEDEYFFNSKVIREIDLVKIELKKVYRQKDIKFIDLLDKVRTGNVGFEDLQFLNSRFGVDQAYIFKFFTLTLTTTNATADIINQAEFSKLHGDLVISEATVKGDWKGEIPAEKRLTLKVGARIVFTKNDYLGRYYNGMMGKILCIDDEKGLLVQTQDDDSFWLQKVTWDYEEYYMENGNIMRRVKGQYMQYPIKLGYAMTIHKSQGLTLCRVAIDLGTGAFVSGQVYVALSRCKALDGILLKTAVKSSDIKTNHKVKEFLKDVNDRKLLMNIAREIGEKERLELEQA